MTEAEMESELLGFFQDRMKTAYQEQTWAVALVGSLNAFIAGNSRLLLEGFGFWVLATGITFISLFAEAFVWSRHCIFVHYDDCLKEELKRVSSGSNCSHSDIPRTYELLARWSGVTLYTLIIFGLWVVAVWMLFVATTSGSA